MIKGSWKGARCVFFRVAFEMVDRTVPRKEPNPWLELIKVHERFLRKEARDTEACGIWAGG